jgi:hypothetical protein
MVTAQAIVPAVNVNQIRPYASAVLLEYTGNDAGSAVSAIVRQLKTLKTRERAGRSVTIVASGLSLPDPLAAAADAVQEREIETDGFICEVRQPPNWAAPDAPFTEITFDLAVVLRRRRLVAVHADQGLIGAIQTWLDKRPSPAFQRIPVGVLNAVLLKGEAKGLWLRGTHARRTTKPDTKNISGRRLQDALNPLEDSSFSMGSARAGLPDDEDFGTLSGTVGTTPRKSLVWISPTDGFDHFVRMIRDLLRVVEATLDTGESVESPYPWLSTEVHDLTGVTGAYELTTLDPGDLPRTPEWAEEALAAAEILQRASFDITGHGTDASFTAEVGLDSAMRGLIACTVDSSSGAVRLAFGIDPAKPATDPPSVRLILDSLSYSDLITVYYESGHAISAGSIYSTTIRPAPFPKWQWRDFTGYNVTQEKPSFAKTQDIHDHIAEDSDVSLFSWVVAHLGMDGWLTCDDGTGEMADFVHYEGDGTVSFVHVKAATSANPNRPVKVTSFEVVTSQATKNLPYLNLTKLIAKLSSPGTPSPACWYNGTRIPDRTEMIDYLKERPAHAPWRVILVQPQMTEHRYERVAAADQSTEKTRLQLLETMLNSARGTVTGLGADLEVIGSL